MAGTVTLTGFKEFEAKLKNLPGILLEEIDGQVEDATVLWHTGAVNDSPTDQGNLKRLLSVKKNAPMEWEVVSGADYSAYIEFGTKTRVNIPSDLQNYAAQFRGGGAGNAKKFIFAWMQRVGIPKEAQYPVFLSIITKGIHPHPYFFIQRPLVQKQLDTNVQRILNTEH